MVGRGAGKNVDTMRAVGIYDVRCLANNIMKNEGLKVESSEGIGFASNLKKHPRCEFTDASFLNDLMRENDEQSALLEQAILCSLLCLN